MNRLFSAVKSAILGEKAVEPAVAVAKVAPQVWHDGKKTPQPYKERELFMASSSVSNEVETASRSESEMPRSNRRKATNGAKTPATAKSGEQTQIAEMPFALDQAEVAQRAWEIWQREGCPQGRDFENWVQAERELSSERRGRR